jgi:hypothetical protein
MEWHDDVRRWATERACGVVRVMLDFEPLLEDVEGAVTAGDSDYAAYVARDLVLRALSVVSLCRGGSVDLDESQANFDFFHAVPDDVVRRGRRLALDALTAMRDDPQRWLAELRDFFAEAEAELGLGPLPRIRTSEGMFKALALARDWAGLCAAVGGPVGVVAPGA